MSWRRELTGSQTVSWASSQGGSPKGGAPSEEQGLAWHAMQLGTHPPLWRRFRGADPPSDQARGAEPHVQVAHSVTSALPGLPLGRAPASWRTTSARLPHPTPTCGSSQCDAGKQRKQGAPITGGETQHPGKLLASGSAVLGSVESLSAQGHPPSTPPSHGRALPGGQRALPTVQGEPSGCEHRPPGKLHTGSRQHLLSHQEPRQVPPSSPDGERKAEQSLSVQKMQLSEFPLC